MAHCSVDKRAYCAIWCEGTCGRGGNDIASALLAILSESPNLKQSGGVYTDTQTERLTHFNTLESVNLQQSGGV